MLEARAFLTLGRHGEEFESRFATQIGVRHAVAVSSGTAALEIILRALKVEGREVIVPTNTFAASVFAVIRAGASVVFADSGEDLSVDPVDVARLVTRNTAAVMSVHIGGVISPAITQLKDICERREVPLVEDAAHAHGTSLHGKQAGAFGAAAGYSFFSTKVMTPASCVTKLKSRASTGMKPSDTTGASRKFKR
jgi:dTDP-4-amino-4,6-dideoxygalactose transaminase